MTDSDSLPLSILIDVKWPQFALVIATEVQRRYLAVYGSTDEWSDEFVVRQVIREQFAVLFPGLSVQAKEVFYDDEKRRLDLTLGDREELSIAIEIKSDPGKLSGVKSDWLKVCDASKPYKLVIFAGICSASDLEKINETFKDTENKLTNGRTAFQLTEQSTSFGQPKTKHAFTRIWYIDVHPPKQLEVRVIA